MTQPSVSVIIPAASEEQLLPRAIASIRKQRTSAEIIVVVNGALDNTLAIAKAQADRVLYFPKLLGYSRARNSGAQIAKADVYVFLDADSFMGPNTLPAILSKIQRNSFGTVMGKPDSEKIRYRAFFLMKNLAHRLHLYHGVLGGLSFCHKNLFWNIRGFDLRKEVDENYDFSRRARATGGTYQLIRNAFATTSMRRFEKTGLIVGFLYWIKVRFFRYRKPYEPARSSQH